MEYKARLGSEMQSSSGMSSVCAGAAEKRQIANLRYIETCGVLVEEIVAVSRCALEEAESRRVGNGFCAPSTFNATVAAQMGFFELRKTDSSSKARLGQI